MKKIIWTIAFVLVVGLPAWAEDIQPHLTVYGTGTINVTPDEMVWTLKVSNRGPGIEKLAEQHSKIVLEVLARIGEVGVDTGDTQTSMMQFGEVWNHKDGRRIQDGYLASSKITFKLTKFAKYQMLWMGVAKIKDTSIQNIGYGYSKRIEAQNKARINALLAAREKALTMAKTLDVALGEPLVIEDSQSFPDHRRSNMLMASDAGFKSGSQETGGGCPWEN